MTRRFLAVLAVATLGLAVTLGAEESAKSKDPLPGIKNAAALQQEMLARQFREFEQSLLRLAQRLERSNKPEDRDRAVLLKKAIDLASKEGIDTHFDKLISILRSARPDDLQEVRTAIAESEKLVKDLREMLNLLLSDNRAAQLKAEEKRITELLKDINKIIRDEKTIRNLNEAGKMDKDNLAKSQERVTKATEDVARALGGNKSDPREGGDQSRDTKPGEGKDSGKAGEGKGDPKEDTQDPKGGDKEGKPSEGKPSEGKPGEGKPSEGKPSEGKPGEGKPSEGKPGEGKPSEGKPSEGKPSEGKPGEGKPSEGKPSEGKPGEGKPSEGKPSEGKPSEGKPGEGKPSEGKPSEGKPGEGKPSEGKPGEGKPSEPKQGEQKGEQSASKGKGDQKGEAKPSDSKSGQPSQGGDQQAKGDQKGQPSQGSQAGGQPKPGQQGGQQGGPQPPQPPQPPADQQAQLPGKKQIQEAIENQKRAEDELKKNNPDEAGQNIDQAIQKLDELRKKLEEILKQIREEEAERVLAALQQRCEEMLRIQIEVYDNTVRVDKALAENPDNRRPQELKALQLADREGEIVVLANQAITILEAEGSGVAFPQVFEFVRKDMMNVQKRLGKANVDQITQKTEQDIIETLKDMVDALKKARQELEAKKNQPPPPGGGGGGQQQEDELLGMLVELKLIRSTQVRIYDRTVTYGKNYPGEQAEAPPDVQKEIQDLATLQQQLEDTVHKIATGKNKTQGQ